MNIVPAVKRSLSRLLPPPPSRLVRTAARLLALGLIAYVSLAIVSVVITAAVAGASAVALLAWSFRSANRQP